MKKIIILGLFLIGTLTFSQEDGDFWTATDKGGRGNHGNPHNHDDDDDDDDDDDSDRPETPIANYIHFLALAGGIYSFKKLKL